MTADMKLEYEEVLARRQAQPALLAAVICPCSDDAPIGAVEAAMAGRLI